MKGSATLPASRPRDYDRPILTAKRVPGVPAVDPWRRTRPAAGRRARFSGRSRRLPLPRHRLCKVRRRPSNVLQDVARIHWPAVPSRRRLLAGDLDARVVQAFDKLECGVQPIASSAGSSCSSRARDIVELWRLQRPHERLGRRRAERRLWAGLRCASWSPEARSRAFRWSCRRERASPPAVGVYCPLGKLGSRWGAWSRGHACYAPPPSEELCCQGKVHATTLGR